MTASPTRTTYRHGDLRRALVDAGYALARDAGPDAVVLREATRRSGVTPSAAYRHFADRRALLAAVCDAAQAALADAIQDEQEAAPDDAVARFLAVGTGYVRFARQEPGLFRTAFSVPDDVGGRGDEVRSGRGGRTPFQLLTDALDRLVEVGELRPEQRAGAEFLAWSAVHGLATLAIDGPLRAVPDEQVSTIACRLAQMVATGLAEPPIPRRRTRSPS